MLDPNVQYYKDVCEKPEVDSGMGEDVNIMKSRPLFIVFRHNDGLLDMVPVMARGSFSYCYSLDELEKITFEEAESMLVVAELG